MKTSIKVLAIIFLIGALLMFGATINQLSAQSLPKQQDKAIKDTVIKSVSYKLYSGSRGGRYIIRTSRTGTTYKQYFTTKKAI